MQIASLILKRCVQKKYNINFGGDFISIIKQTLLVIDNEYNIDGIYDEHAIGLAIYLKIENMNSLFNIIYNKLNNKNFSPKNNIEVFLNKIHAIAEDSKKQPNKKQIISSFISNVIKEVEANKESQSIIYSIKIAMKHLYLVGIFSLQTIILILIT